MPASGGADAVGAGRPRVTVAPPVAAIAKAAAASTERHGLAAMHGRSATRVRKGRRVRNGWHGQNAKLEASIGDFVRLLVNHRPRALKGRSLIEAMEVEKREPVRLTGYFERWRASPREMYRARPSLVFAVIGQARARGELTPEAEARVLGKLLTHWALRATLDTSAFCAALPKRRASAPAT